MGNYYILTRKTLLRKNLIEKSGLNKLLDMGLAIIYIQCV